MPNTVSANYDFVVNPAGAGLSIANQPPPPATVGQPYTFTFTATGGAPPYTWALSPSIPGLTLDSATGILSGTPTMPGTTPISVTVTDSAP